MVVDLVEVVDLEEVVHRLVVARLLEVVLHLVLLEVVHLLVLVLETLELPWIHVLSFLPWIHDLSCPCFLYLSFPLSLFLFLVLF